MFNPSSVKPESEPIVVKESANTYSFPDAYSGVYEFFDNRPIQHVVRWLDVNADQLAAAELEAASVLKVVQVNLEKVVSEAQAAVQAVQSEQVQKIVSEATAAIVDIQRRIGDLSKPENR